MIAYCSEFLFLVDTTNYEQNELFAIEENFHLQFKGILRTKSGGLHLNPFRIFFGLSEVQNRS